jgi:cyclomaltodextrinase
VFHRNGIRVILDAVFNHVGRDFPQFNDFLARGKSSEFMNWFSGVDFNKRNRYNDPFSYDCWNGHEGLVKLNLSDKNVKDHLLNAVSMWIEDFGIDGLRLDAADCIDIGFLRELNQFAKARKPDFMLIGEVIHGDYRKWVNAGTLDSVTNYENYKSLYSSHNDSNYFELAYSLNRQYGDSGMYRGLSLYDFADNHDVTRLASILKKREHLYPAMCLLFTMPGSPSIYYGSEFGVSGIKGKSSDRELRPELSLSGLYSDPPEPGLLPVVKKLSRIRREQPALRYGSYRQLVVSDKQFVFAREYEGGSVIIGVNSDSASKIVECTIPENLRNRRFFDALNDEDCVDVKGSKLTHHIWPNWGFILVSE